LGEYEGRMCGTSGFSRTFDDVAETGPGHIVVLLACYDESTTRALSNSKPARPYICRLIIFKRFT
jgi:hypothetical protein